MKKRFIYTLIGLGFLGFTSCDNLEGYYDAYNEKPEITIKKELGEEFIREFTDSLKIGNPTYTFSFKIKDEESNLVLTYSCDDSEVVVEKEDDKIKVSSQVTGIKKIVLITEDAFGETDQTTMTLEVFNNLLPVAKQELRESETMLSPLERIIDASKSYDGDEKFGGKIDKYQFRIENQSIIETSEPFIKHIFAGKGSYKIWSRVKDNNDEWSEAVIERYNIQ